MIISLFFYSIGRMILTKAPWVYDPNGDRDREDITSLYKAKEGKYESYKDKY